MLRPTLVITAAMLPLVVSGNGSAKDNTINFGFTCGCICRVEGGGPLGTLNDYHFSDPIDCTALNGRTCNSEEEPGQIRTGTLAFCNVEADTAGGRGAGAIRNHLETIAPAQTLAPADQAPVRPQLPGRRMPGRVLAPAE